MLTLDKIISGAKHKIARFGGLEPTIFVEGTNNLEIAPLPDLSESLKHAVLEALGFTLAKENRVGELVQLFLVSEGWRVRRRANEGYRGALQPKHAPDRIECVMVFRYQVRPETRRMILYDIVRNNAGELTELRPVTTPSGERVESPTLDALLRGFQRGREQFTSTTS